MVQKQNKVILIIDDESSITELAVDLLAGEGYQTYGTTSGTDALSLLGEIPCPDLILVDCLMPAMPGEAFVRTMQQQFPACAKHARIVGMSGLPSDSSIKKEFDTLIHAFESKPEDLDQWIELARKYLN